MNEDQRLILVAFATATPAALAFTGIIYAGQLLWPIYGAILGGIVSITLVMAALIWTAR